MRLRGTLNLETRVKARCDFLNGCSFRPADESVSTGKDVPVAVGVRQLANDVNVDMVES